MALTILLAVLSVMSLVCGGVMAVVAIRAAETLEKELALLGALLAVIVSSLFTLDVVDRAGATSLVAVLLGGALFTILIFFLAVCYIAWDKDE